MTAVICHFPRQPTAALGVPPDDDEATPAARLIRCSETLEAMIEAGEFEATRDDTRGIIGQLPFLLRDIAGQVR